MNYSKERNVADINLLLMSTKMDAKYRALIKTWFYYPEETHQDILQIVGKGFTQQM